MDNSKKAETPPKAKSTKKGKQAVSLFHPRYKPKTRLDRDIEAHFARCQELIDNEKD